MRCAIYTKVSTDNQAAIYHIGYMAKKLNLIPVKLKKKKLNLLLQVKKIWKFSRFILMLVLLVL
jgi:hypothetical protein